MNTVTKKQLKIDGSFAVFKNEREKDNEKKSSQSNVYKHISIATELGFAISLPIVGGVLLGSYLDKKFLSSPKFTLSLLFLGLFLGIFNFFYIIRESTRE